MTRSHINMVASVLLIPALFVAVSCQSAGTTTTGALSSTSATVLGQKEYRVVWHDRFPGLTPATKAELGV